jgi:acetyl-CoA/propionyl-CoA carboxylase biotin carboxyl carrier protein
VEKVLIANRGEIAVRIIRACQDLGLGSVAVYTDADRDAPHTRMADEAFALPGRLASETFLDIGALLRVAVRARVDAVHPGYGFLSENPRFAEAVIDAGIVWIGPPPDAMRQLGDKVSARAMARLVGAPLAPGTESVLTGPAEAVAFAHSYGLPIALKAAHGGGGRGLRVARTLAEIPEQFEAAAREAASAFGRPECFAERYLDRARHVETQCLADRYGAVTVVSTRDCSVQRRRQKLIEEAPAPYLPPAVHERLVTASKAILANAGYVGAGTCEFLLGADGDLSFLEVNARLQVEHPVSEEVTGVDLVCEQLRIAMGEPLVDADPKPHGHAIEFRINAEDAGRGFAPTPGQITGWEPPSGPGVRVDSGVVAGTVVTDQFDSMLAKLVVTGRDRAEALRRSRRALAEFRVVGLPTVLPFHRLVAAHPDFAPTDPDEAFAVHTGWVETVLAGVVAPDGQAALAPPAPPPPRERITLEVDGRRIEVAVPAGLSIPAPVSRTARRRIPSSVEGAPGTSVGPAGAVLASPMPGTVVKVAVTEGQSVAAGELVVVLEAMKMEQPVFAHRGGTVAQLTARIGAPVTAGQPICQINE